MGGDVTLAGRFSEIRTQNGHVKVKGRLSRGNSAGRAPSLRGIPWNLPYNLGKSTEKPLSGQSKNVNWARFNVLTWPPLWVARTSCRS